MAQKRRRFDDTAEPDFVHDFVTRYETTINVTNRVVMETYGDVNIRVEEKKRGTLYTAQISEGDTELFQALLACVLRIYWTDYNGTERGHALFMLRNQTTGVCEIFDPEGNMDGFRRHLNLWRLFEALNSGLLNALVSPSSDVVTPIAVHTPSNEGGLQAALRLDEDRLANHISTASGLPPKLRLGLKSEFLSPRGFGFCLTCSIFRFVDQVYNNQAIYKACERAFVSGESFDEFTRVATDEWFGTFLKETGLKDNTEAKQLFQLMVPHLFIRNLAVYFMRCAKKTVTSEAGSNLWPILDPEQKTPLHKFRKTWYEDTNCFKVLLAQLKPLHPLVFNKEIWGLSHSNLQIGSFVKWATDPSLLKKKIKTAGPQSKRYKQTFFQLLDNKDGSPLHRENLKEYSVQRNVSYRRYHQIRDM